jgi:hypothetical protein
MRVCSDFPSELDQILHRFFGSYKATSGCGSGSGIRCLFYPWIGIRIRDEQPGSYFREFKIFWVKTLKFFDADPGWKKFVSGIRDSGWKKFHRKASNTNIHLGTRKKSSLKKNCLSVLSLLEVARSQSVPPTTWKQT